MQDAIATLRCGAILFDLDGVLVDSTTCVEQTWRRWAATHGLDGDALVELSHGRRAMETVRQVMPQADDAWIAAEVATLIAHEAQATDGVREVPGAAAMLARLPAGQWAIVTSGVRAVAEHRLRHVGLPIPPVMICADDIARGKPDPLGYLTAAARLGVERAACVVIEDAPAGIAAALAGGMRAVAVATTHAPSALRGAIGIVSALRDLRLVLEPDAPVATRIHVMVGRSG